MSTLPVLAYGVETMLYEVKLKTTQRAIERVMLGVSLRDKITNHEIRQSTGVEDVMERVARNKWRWPGHLARQEGVTNHILKWG
ncbi:hypothetical protein Trydic_g15671 [Trypoxylus dichotomus]